MCQERFLNSNSKVTLTLDNAYSPVPRVKVHFLSKTHIYNFGVSLKGGAAQQRITLAGVQAKYLPAGIK